MSSQLIDQALNINLTHSHPAPVGPGYPNTGGPLQAVMDGLGPVGCSFILTIVITLVLGVIAFYLYKKFSSRFHSPKSSISAGLGIVAFCAGLLTLGTMTTVQALRNTAPVNDTTATVNMNIDIPEGRDSVVATQKTNLMLEDEYPEGYIVYAYTDADGNLYNTANPSAFFAPTTPAISADNLALNSYGIENEQHGYAALSTDSFHPTKLFDTEASTLAGTFVPITYAAKAGVSLLDGSYSSNGLAIHFDIEPDVYNLTYSNYKTKSDTIDGDLEATPQPHDPNFTLAEAPSRDGYYFKGYDTDYEGNGTRYYPGETFVADYVQSYLHTIWQAKTPTVTFNANGGHFATEAELTKDIVETYDQKYELPTEPTRLGYNFAGWYTAAEGGTQVDADTIVKTETDHTLYAHWTAHKHQISYSGLEGVTKPFSGDLTGTYDQDVSVPNPVHTGYTFLGWTISGMDSGTHYRGDAAGTYQEFTGETASGIKSTHFKNLTAEEGATVDFVAYWQENTYNLKFDANAGGDPTVEGVPADPQTQLANPTFTISNATPTRTGYTFKSYNTKEDGTGVAYAPGDQITLDEPQTGYTSTQTLYAIWDVNLHKISYDFAGGTYGAKHPEKGTYNQDVEISNPTKTGYIFTGWDIDGMDTGTHYYGDTASYGNTSTATTLTGIKATHFKNLNATKDSTVTFTATWQANQYDVTFDANGGHFSTEAETTKNIPETYDKKYILPTQPTRLGYTFAGWWTDKTGGTEITATTDVKITGEQTLYAHWQANTYSLEYNANTTDSVSGMPSDPEPQEHNPTFTISNTIPTRLGYTFLGWNTDKEATTATIQPGGSTTVPEPAAGSDTSTQTLYAIWKLNHHNVTYDLAGGDYGGPGYPTNVAYNADIPVPNPVKDGYIFKGWTISGMDTNTHYYGDTTEYGNESTATNLERIKATHFKNLQATDGYTVNFRAVWVQLVTFDQAFEKAGKAKATAADGNEYYQMKDMDASICSAITAPLSAEAADTQVGILVDTRDNKLYHVAKLLDGQCWMTDNLALELNTSQTLTNENTDLNSVSSWTPERSTGAAWSNDNNNPYSLIPSGAPAGSGVYYNWSAAVANNDTSSYTTDKYQMPDSICPKGWQLPIMDGTANITTNQLAKLFTAYGWNSSTYYMDPTDALLKEPLNFVLAGYVGSGSLSNVDDYGYLWSPVVESGTYAYYGQLGHDGFAGPDYGYIRYNGQSVRCVVNTNTYYQLKYDANTTDAVTGMPSNQTQVNNNSITISNDTPTRANYNFKGWAATKDATEADPNLAPGKTISLTAETPAKTLYAVWESAVVTFDKAYAKHNKTPVTVGDKQYYKMSDMDASICADVTPAASTAAADTQTGILVDTRDNKLYHVAKLLDGQCWMTDNLALELNTSQTLTNENTDLHSVSSWKPLTSTVTDLKDWLDDFAPYPQSVKVDDTVYYNLTAAVANNDTLSYTTDSYQMPDSICPKGWQLPIMDGTVSTTTNQLAKLLTEYGWNSSTMAITTDLAAPPLSFTKDGYVKATEGGGGTIEAGDVAGYLWASVIKNGEHAYVFGFMDGMAVPSSSSHRQVGQPVRCVLNTNTYYQLKYDANTTDAVTGMPSNQTQVNNNSITISNDTPTRANYNFKGWATSKTATTAEVQPGDPITIPEPATGEVESTQNLYAVWEKSTPIAYTVHYDANGGSGVPADQTAPLTADDYTFTLTDLATDKIPTRGDYTFGGWTTVATNQAGAYSPGSELYLTKDSPEITLYAIWVPNSEMKFGSLTGTNAKMQNMTSSVCSAVSKGTTGRLQDTRDYKIYYVTKEADNKCWMTQNLSLDLRTDKALTSADSNVSSWTPERKTVPNGNLTSSNWATGSDYTNPYSFNPADNYFVPNDVISESDPSTTSGDAHYTAGNYYTWSAAVASNDTQDHSRMYENMPDSICPKGWRLPKTTSGSSTEFGALLHTTGITSSDTSTSYATDGFIKIRQDPLWLVRSGYVYSGSRDNLGNVGDYWSSAVYSSDVAYGLYFRQNGPGPMYSYSRHRGLSIRCLASS